MRKLIFLVLLLFISNTPALADLAKGQKALRNGDFATALEELKPLAEQGDNHARALLGNMHINGKGVPKDINAGVKWFQIAAEDGYLFAQERLCNWYRRGKNVLQDYKAMFKYCKLSAEQGTDLFRNPYSRILAG